MSLGNTSRVALNGGWLFFFFPPKLCVCITLLQCKMYLRAETGLALTRRKASSEITRKMRMVR